MVAKATGFNYVVKKAAAQMLVSMGDGKPILTVWRYGLGRVVALSTDNGDKWSSELLSQKNSKLLTRAINWAIGDPQKNMQFSIRTKDTYLGETTQLIVKSDKVPTSDTLLFEETENDIYVTYVTPKNIGFENYYGAFLAVNSEKEYERVGFNPDLRTLVGITGGKVFDPDNTDELVEFIKDVSRRKKTTPLYIRWPFIAAALLLFIFEIFIRRIIQSVRRRT